MAVKLGLEAFPPLWSGFLRFALGCACVALWARYAGIALRPAREEWPGLLGMGLLFTVQIALMNVGFGLTSASNSAVLIATNPLFGVLFAHLLVPGDRVGPLRAAGVAVAFAGTALVLARGVPAPGAGGWGDWIVLASAGLLGLRLALSGRMLKRQNEVPLTFWMMAVSLPLFLAGGLAFETIRWEAIAAAPVLGILYQGVDGRRARLHRQFLADPALYAERDDQFQLRLARGRRAARHGDPGGIADPGTGRRHAAAGRRARVHRAALRTIRARACRDAIIAALASATTESNP